MSKELASLLSDISTDETIYTQDSKLATIARPDGNETTITPAVLFTMLNPIDTPVGESHILLAQRLIAGTGLLSNPIDHHLVLTFILDEDVRTQVATWYETEHDTEIDTINSDLADSTLLDFLGE